MFGIKQREIDRLSEIVANQRSLIKERDKEIDSLRETISNIKYEHITKLRGLNLSESILKEIITKYRRLTKERDEEIQALKTELTNAKDLSEILGKLTEFGDKYVDPFSFARYSPTGNLRVDLVDLPDNYLQYVDDILGGKVIKQDGTKCLVITKDGEVKTGLTKSKPDKGYSYKLVREQT